MSGSLIGGIAGAALGFFVPVIGPALGFALGSTAGSLLFPGSLPTQYGPRLEDLRPQTSEYGKPIPLVFGTVGMGGNVIWVSDYVEVETKTEQGGKGGPSQTTVTYSYYANFAVAFAQGPNTIGRMWAGPSKRLIYDGVLLEGGGTVRIYEGTESQLPDPLIESYEGVGNVPAHRGVTYVVFEMFPLSEDGNAIPFITAEVGAKAGAHGQEPIPVAAAIPVPDNQKAKAVVDPATGWIWQVSDEFLTGEYTVRVINDAKQEIIATWTLPSPDQSSTTCNLVAFPHGGQVLLLIRPWVNDDPRAYVASFSSGLSNADGSVNQAPMFMDGGFWGGMAGPSGIGVSGSNVWIKYGFNSTTQANFTVFKNGNPGDYVELGLGYSMGAVLEFAGDAQYVAAIGIGGPINNPNIAIFDQSALAPVLLHTHRLDDLGSMDYDPVRQRFIALATNKMEWLAIDAATGEETIYPLTIAAGDTSPPPSTATVDIAYSAKTDRYLVGANGAIVSGSGTTIYLINPDTGATEGTYTFEAGGQMLFPLLDPAADLSGPPYVLSFDQNTVKRLYLGGAVEATPMNLGAIVAALSQRAGLGAGQIDVAALTDMVDGYAIARQTTVRAAIDALRPAYYFDAVESGGKVKFVKRGGAASAVIDDNDLDAHQADGQPGDPLLTTRQMEVELPKVCNVNYLLAANDYEKATQTYSRQIGSSEEETTLDLPLVLTDTKGQEVAQVNTHAAWVQRIKYGPFTLPRKYSDLEPTDIITIRGHEMMLEKVTASPGGVLTCEAVATDSSHYTPHVVVTETVPTEKLVYIPGETTLELM